MQPSLHEERIEVARQRVIASGARSVLDLGCGAGGLLVCLSREPQLERLVGVDIAGSALLRAERELGDALVRAGGRVELLHGSFTEPDPRLAGFDAAVLLETIEHIEPDRLSRVETAVFAQLCPKLVLVSTPNREYNVLYDQPETQRRHPDHRFEWSRARFESWARGVATRNGYTVAFDGIGERHPKLGCPTQLAEFRQCGDGRPV